MQKNMRSLVAEAATARLVHRQTHWLVETLAAQARLVSISVGDKLNISIGNGPTTLI